MTKLRGITVSGPTVRTAPLWEATIAVAYSGPDSKPSQPRPVVQKTQGIRVLVQEARTSQIRIGSQRYPLHKPRLLQAAIEARDNWTKLVVGGGDNKENIKLKDTRSEALADVVLTLADPTAPWPADHDEIETARFLLAAGRIRTWLRLKPRRPNMLPKEEPWFGYRRISGSARLFCDANWRNGVEVFSRQANGSTWLPVVLTAEGIMFLAKVPDPLQAFDGQARSIWAWVRLVEQPGPKTRPSFALAFVGACADPQLADWTFPDPDPDPRHAQALERSLHELFQDARRNYDIRVDFDERPSVPPLRWEMELRANSSRPMFPKIGEQWSVEFDPALFRINFFSTIDGLASTATLRCEIATLNVVRATANSFSSLRLGSLSPPSGQRRLSASRKRGEDSWAVSPARQTFEAPRLVLKEVKERLTAIYRDAKLYDPARDGAVQAFVPVEHGWLQLPLRASPPPSVSEALPDPVLDGDMALVLDPERNVAIEIGAASAGSLDLVIDSTSTVACSQVDLAFQDITGRMRGLLHIADCAPADGEILPTLRPGATREWPIRFGAGPTDGCLSAKGTNIVDRKVTLALDTEPKRDDPTKGEDPVEGGGIAWLRDGAWISTLNLAQSEGSGAPVAARSLVPRAVKNVCTLQWSAAATLPAVDGTSLNGVWKLWEDAPATTQLLPTLPGIERHGLTGNFTFTLRHDLPALDDLFASVQLEDTPLLLLGQKVESAPTRDPTATAVAPKRLRDAWRVIRDNARLTATRLRIAFAGEPSGNNVEVHGLAEPYKWEQVPFDFAIDNGYGLPLGSYLLDGETYAGGVALAGLVRTVVLGNGRARISVDVTGNASARWLESKSDLLHDVAGMGIARTASIARSVEVLTAPATALSVTLTTRCAPLPLAEKVWFWFRDIPFVSGVFDGSDGVDGFSSDADNWSAERFARSLYEWRIWSKDEQGTVRGDIPLTLGFAARPLRLKRIEENVGGVTRVEIVAALVAPAGLDASGESESGATAPARNLILLTYAADAHGGFTRTVARVRIQNGQVEPFDGSTTFDVRPTVVMRESDQDNDQDAPGQPGVLTFELATDGSVEKGRLSLVLFGRTIDFSQSGSGEGGDFASLIFGDLGAVTHGTLDFKSCELRWSTGDGDKLPPTTFVTEPSIELPLIVRSGATTVTIDLWHGTVRWLGAIIEKSAITYSHDKSEIKLGTVSSTRLRGSPVRGLVLEQVDIVDGLFVLCPDRKLSGLLQLAASRQGDGGDSFASALRHSFVMTGGHWVNRMVLDLEGGTRSSIDWPLGVTTPDAPRPEPELSQPFTIYIAAGAALTHHVYCTIRDARVPVEALSSDGQLELPWHLPMRVGHRLDSAIDGHQATWTSLDEVTLADIATLRAAPARTAYGFAARYKGTYRGNVAAPPLLVGGGILERALAAAGFPDNLVRDALAGANNVSGLILLGAGVSLMRLPPPPAAAGATPPAELREEESALLALPWLVGVGDAVLGPLDALRQAPGEGSKAWKAAWFDTRAAKLLPSAPILPLKLGDASAAIIAGQLTGPGDNGVNRSLASVEQPFFESEDGSAIDIAEAPLFLRSLVALSKSWTRLSSVSDLQARIVQPIPRGDGSCALFAPTPEAAPREKLTQVRALCIHPEEVRFSEIDTGLDLGTITASIGVIRELRVSIDPQALLFGLITYQAGAGAGDDLVDWEISEFAPVTVARPLVRLGAATAALRDPADRLFAAPSLGWPEQPWPDEPMFPVGPFALTLGDNQPFQSGDAAVAGRLASYAVAAGASAEGRPWLSRHQPVVFAKAALPGTLGAAPRHRDIVPRRARLPLASDQPTLVPSRFATAVVGRRPGTVYGEIVAFKSSGGTVCDVEGNALGLRATLHPVIAGQDRMPRATVFPRDVDDLSWRRETFVVPGGRKCRIDHVPSIAFRTYAEPTGGTEIPPPAELVVLSALKPVLDLEGATSLELLVDGPLPDNDGWQPYGSREFRIRVGDRTWPLGEGSPLSDGSRGIALPLSPVESEQILEAARDATGNTVVACELDLAGSAPVPDQPMPAPSLRLRLPLTISLKDRPRLAIEQSTLIFGDPAYDRMLSSMTVSDTRRLGGSLFILAADRESYDNSTPILIGFAEHKSDGIVEWPEFSLGVTWYRDGATSPEPQDPKKITVKNVFALTFDELAANYGLPAIAPGDRITITARVPADDSPPLVELSVQLQVAREPVVPPAPAVYHLMTLHGAAEPSDAATSLSASGPTPTVVEYGSLKEDLIGGYVRRRALFVWRFTPDSAPRYDQFGYLVKIDRSGAGQLPDTPDDFEAAAAIERVAPPSTRKTAWE